MKTAGRETPNHRATLPQNRAHGAVGQNRSRSIEWAAKQEKFGPMQECFFLTSTFIELGTFQSRKFAVKKHTSLCVSPRKYLLLSLQSSLQMAANVGFDKLPISFSLCSVGCSIGPSFRPCEFCCQKPTHKLGALGDSENRFVPLAKAMAPHQVGH